MMSCAVPVLELKMSCSTNSVAIVAAPLIGELSPMPSKPSLSAKAVMS